MFNGQTDRVTSYHKMKNVLLKCKTLVNCGKNFKEGRKLNLSQEKYISRSSKVFPTISIMKASIK